jgi:thiamine pyrophosphate-dependent acetolactate synthase large subunit-like protein
MLDATIDTLANATAASLTEKTGVEVVVYAEDLIKASAQPANATVPFQEFVADTLAEQLRNALAAWSEARPPRILLSYSSKNNPLIAPWGATLI